MEQLTVQQLGANAKAVAGTLAAASPKQKNDALAAIADALISRTPEIIEANKADLENAVKNNMSKAMQAGPGSASVYTFPQVLNDQVEQILENVTDPDALRQYTRQTIYLTYPNYHSNTFGTANTAANSILAKLLKTNSLGPTAKANEQPVLVLVELADGFTLLVSVFPGENHLYAYSFVCVPQAYDIVVARIEASGGNMIE